MRRSAVSTCVAAAITLGAGGACGSGGDPLMPDAGVGSGGLIYVLRSVQAEAVPAVWLANASVEIMLPCPDVAICVAPPHFIGRVTADGLIFDRALSYPTPLRYERVRS